MGAMFAQLFCPHLFTSMAQAKTTYPVRTPPPLLHPSRQPRVLDSSSGRCRLQPFPRWRRRDSQLEHIKQFPGSQQVVRAVKVNVPGKHFTSTFLSCSRRSRKFTMNCTLSGLPGVSVVNVKSHVELIFSAVSCVCGLVRRVCVWGLNFVAIWSVLTMFALKPIFFLLYTKFSSY